MPAGKPSRKYRKRKLDRAPPEVQEAVRARRARMERMMFEKSFLRPSNYFRLSDEEQWRIDERLGILDWEGEGLSEEDLARFRRHYGE